MFIHYNPFIVFISHLYIIISGAERCEGKMLSW